MERYSTVGKTGNVDDYINPGASSELPPPPELKDPYKQIKMLQEDVKRSAQCIGQRDAQISCQKKEIKRLKEIIRRMEKRLSGEDLEPVEEKPTVRELRFRRGWSCPELARRAGLTYDIVYKRERKQYIWREEQKKAVAKALGVAVDSVDWDG